MQECVCVSGVYITETPLILVARGASAGYVVNNKINLMCVFFVSGGGGQESDYLF